jgi:predicted permease
MSAFSNSVFIGIPVCTALFGEKSIGYVLMYYLSSLLLFWTIGAYGISKDAPDSRETEFSSGNMKRIFSPPLIAFLLTVALIMFGIKAPGFILNAGKYMGELSTPMSMLMIGAIICSMGLRSIKLDRDAAVLMILRFIVAPLLVFSLVHFVPAPVLMKKVFVIESALPVQAQTAIVTNAYDADSGYAAGMITITTITGLMFIPLYMLLANYV